MPEKAHAKSALTQAQELLLKSQTISQDGPGSVLRDFETMREFIGREAPPAAGKFGTLPIGLLSHLNGMMTQPFNVNLGRPQFRSFPNLQGLFLLLRATSMVVDRPGSGKSSDVRLAINPEIARSWDQLNPTERYFTLLEAWLLYGTEQMVGDDRGGGSFAFDVLRKWESVEEQGRQISTNPNNRSWLLYDPYHTALMGLFGWAEIEQAPPHQKQVWTPRRITPTPFGDALAALIGSQLRDYSAVAMFWSPRSPTATFGTWQQLFRPYFPEWKHNLTQLKAPRIDGVFIVKVSLGKVWRQLAVPSRANLDQMVCAILRAFRFDNDHLYSVSVKQPNGSSVEYSHPFSEQQPATTEARFERLPLQPGSKMKLVYDFGDWWEFDILVERIDPPGSTLKAPKLLAEFGKPPPQYGDEYEDDEEQEADDAQADNDGDEAQADE